MFVGLPIALLKISTGEHTPALAPTLEGSIEWAKDGVVQLSKAVETP